MPPDSSNASSSADAVRFLTVLHEQFTQASEVRTWHDSGIDGDRITVVLEETPPGRLLGFEYRLATMARLFTPSTPDVLASVALVELLELHGQGELDARRHAGGRPDAERIEWVISV